MSSDLSFPRPVSLPPLVVPPVGCESKLVVLRLFGMAVGRVFVELDDSVVVLMEEEKGVAPVSPRCGPRGGSVGLGNSVDVGDGESLDVLLSVSVGLAGLRTAGGATPTAGGGGGAVGLAPGGNVVLLGEGESSSSDEISPLSSRTSICRSSLIYLGRRIARLCVYLVSLSLILASRISNLPPQSAHRRDHFEFGNE